MKIRKAIIPVAGLGTRFLPATKSIPKEMMPIVDQPLVQYAVDEAFEAGIEHVVFVTGRNKQAIEDYFDIAPELMGALRESGKSEMHDNLDRLLPTPGKITFTRQQEPAGLGHAVWCARDIVGDEPFALLLPDMIAYGGRGCLAEIIELHAATQGNVLAVSQCDPLESHKFGIVERGEAVANGFAVTGMVEKPAQGTAPSNFYINGRYVLQPEVFALLDSQERGAGGEIQLTDAMKRLAKQQPFFALPYSGRMFDCGSKEGFIEANVAFALQRPDLEPVVVEAVGDLIAAHTRRGVAA